MGLISAQVNANLAAMVVLSIVLTPLLLVVVRPLLRRGGAHSLRRRDLQRFNMEVASGSSQAGMDRLYRNAAGQPAEPLTPTPLVEPRRKVEAVQAEGAVIP